MALGCVRRALKLRCVVVCNDLSCICRVLRSAAAVGQGSNVWVPALPLLPRVRLGFGPLLALRLVPRVHLGTCVDQLRWRPWCVQPGTVHQLPQVQTAPCVRLDSCVHHHLFRLCPALQEVTGARAACAVVCGRDVSVLRSLGSGNTACASCLAGTACPSMTSGPVNCLPGTYSSAGAIACSVCPSGFACAVPSAASPAVPCPPGSYSVGGAASCTSCVAGNACPVTTLEVIVKCAPGTWSFGGASNCTVCAAGWRCPNPTGTGRVQCALGTFAVAGTTLCTPCPAGFACPDPTSDAMSPCVPGTYSTGSSTQCVVCPRGSACPFVDRSVVTPCGNGYFSVGESAFMHAFERMRADFAG